MTIKLGLDVITRKLMHFPTIWRGFHSNDFPTDNDDEAGSIGFINQNIDQDDIHTVRINSGCLKAIIDELNPRKAPGYDMITGEPLQLLPRKGRF